MKSNIEYNKKIAKKFHNTECYESAEFQKKNLEFMSQQKLKPEKKETVTRKIKGILNEADKQETGKVFKIIEKILNKNRNYAFGKDEIKPNNSDLLNLLANPDLLTVAYQKVKKNKCIITEALNLSGQECNKITGGKPFVNGAINCSDKINKELIKITGILIKQNRYPWGCNKIIYVDKPGKKDIKRPITIPSLMDKIVQEAIIIILTAIYEPYFEVLNCGLGFRPNKGVHDAIVALIGSNETGLKMAIQGNIKLEYGKVNAKKFIEILGKRIQDKKFLIFLQNRINYEFNSSKKNKYIKDEEGLPQVGTDSSYMWNIYMSTFDEFIMSYLKEKFDILNNKRTGEKFNSVYKAKKENQFQDETFYALKEVTEKINLEEEQEINKIKINLTNLNRYLEHENTKLQTRDLKKLKLRFIYVRYADDWIILSNAKTQIIEKIKEEIKNFLKEKLDIALSIEKMLITNITEKPAHFLGFEVKTSKSKKIGRYKTRTEQGKIITIKSISTGYKVFTLPDRKKILNKLYMEGYCDEKGFPRELGFLTNLEDFLIIEKFNSVIRNMTNYYTEFIKNPKINLSRWIYIIRYSCIKTIAQKHKSSIKQIFKQYKVPKNEKTPGENTIMVKIKNVINGEIYEKSWKLLKKNEAIKEAMSLNRKKYLTDIYWKLKNKEIITYNDNFYEN